MLWEHEVYNSMEYNAPMSYFHTFEGEECMTAFNFADETEAFVLRYVQICLCYSKIAIYVFIKN